MMSAILIIGIVWILLIIILFIISLIGSKRDEKKAEVAVYKLSPLRHITIASSPVIILLIFIVCFFLGLIPLVGFFKGYYIVGIIGVLITGSSLFAIYYSIVALLLHSQYYRIEKGKEIICDRTNSKIVFKNIRTNCQEELFGKDILKIEINYATGNSRIPTYGYEYIKFFTKSGDEFIITSLQTNIDNLIYFFKSVKRIHIYRKINWIK